MRQCEDDVCHDKLVVAVVVLDVGVVCEGVALSVVVFVCADFLKFAKQACSAEEADKEVFNPAHEG